MNAEKDMEDQKQVNIRIHKSITMLGRLIVVAYVGEMVLLILLLMR